MKLSPVRFEDVPHRELSEATLEKQAENLIQDYARAQSTDEALSVVLRWNQAQVAIEQERNLTRLRYLQNTADAQRRHREEIQEKLGPILSQLSQRFVSQVIASPHRNVLERHLGAHAFTLWQQQDRIVDPRIAPLEEQEAAKVRQYRELMANMTLTIDGTNYTLSSVRSLTMSLDRQQRLAARVAMDIAFAEHREVLDTLFSELVALRTEMGQTLGYLNFIPLGYRRMNRTDYGPEEVARFREQIIAHIVPVVHAIRERRAAALGITDLAFHDESVPDPKGAILPVVSGEALVAPVRSVLEEVAPPFAEVFDQLAQQGFVDLAQRPGKVMGASTESLPHLEVPFILANFNGTHDDVIALLHECGHALQYWLARKQPLREYHWPSNDACEIASMGMELLAHPHMERFFGDDAVRFRRAHLEDSLGYLLWDTSADAFQHLVYANPDATPDARQQMWQSIERTYLPWRRYLDLPWFSSGHAWQTYALIYRVPFYGIDYALALISALQLWAQARTDRAGALARYATLCRLGGSLPYQQLLQEAGLESPFVPGTLESIIAQVVAELGL